MDSLKKFLLIGVSNFLPVLWLLYLNQNDASSEVFNYGIFFFYWSFLYPILGFRTEYNILKNIEFDIPNSVGFVVILNLVLIFSIFIFFTSDAVYLILSALMGYMAHCWVVYQLALSNDMAYAEISCFRALIILSTQVLIWSLGVENFLILGHTIGLSILLVTISISNLKLVLQKSIKFSRINLKKLNNLGMIYFLLISSIVNIMPTIYFKQFDDTYGASMIILYRLMIGGALVFSVVISNQLLVIIQRNLTNEEFFVKLGRKLFLLLVCYVLISQFFFYSFTKSYVDSNMISKDILGLFLVFLPRVLLSPFAVLVDYTQSYRSIIVTVVSLLAALMILFHVGVFSTTVLVGTINAIVYIIIAITVCRDYGGKNNA